MVSDVLLQRVPFVLVAGFYATCALIGGVVFWATTTVGVGDGSAAGMCAAVLLGLRAAAIRRDWELPTV
jgi:uncharacterized membrane protein YeiH